MSSSSISYEKLFFSLCVVIVFSIAVVSGQPQQISIPFIGAHPEIDGSPDSQLDNIQWREFPVTEKTDSLCPDIQVRYKIGYGFDFLYLIIESSGDNIIYRDRAYQNGDGFHMVIAKPVPSGLADEFYVLRFSPANGSKNLPATSGIWYYNINLLFQQLKGDTRFVSKSSNGASYFEMLLPWSQIPPYQPLFSDSIGINLCFVKAINDRDMIYYFMKYDNDIQTEQHKRKYLTAAFEKPAWVTHSCSFTQLLKNNITAGHDLSIKTISCAEKSGGLSFSYSIQCADKRIIKTINHRKTVSNGITASVFRFPFKKFPAGSYKLVWKVSDHSEGEVPFTILPSIDFEKELDHLRLLSDNCSEGDLNSMKSKLQNIVQSLGKLKSYETADAICERYSLFKGYENMIRNGESPFVLKNKAFRRAFLSTIDTTLQPYSIRLPKDYDNKLKYPLFVMLHGSGSDDQYVLGGSMTENRFIEIAPNGRGTSNCFTSDGAEIDVKEAIDDAIRNYSIDTSKIILSGFSMGGYGAYRIFYEYPKLFKGVAVFSGHPDLASRWIGTGYPDFLKAEYLKPFRNIPLFIYHSKNDMNCPFYLTSELVEKLKIAGAKVDFVTTDEGGHGLIDDQSMPLFYEWLRNIISK
jgi:Prolyl oligopeptidase family